jgi:hypothetical protein
VAGVVIHNADPLLDTWISTFNQNQEHQTMNAVKIIVAVTIAAVLSGCVVVPSGGYYRGGGYYGHGGHHGGWHRR